MAIRAKGLKWQVDLTVAGKRLPRYSFDTPKEAAVWEAEARAAFLAGRDIPRPVRLRRRQQESTLSFSQVAQRCWDHRWRGTRSAHWYQLNIGQLVRFFGRALPINMIDSDLVAEFCLHMAKEGRSDSTINRKLATLSVIFGFARSRGWIKDIPEMRRRREGRHRIRWLSQAEERAMMECFQRWSQDDHLDAFVVFIDTGLRMGELWQAEGRDVIPPVQGRGHGAISVWKGKTEASTRAVPLTRRAADVLQRRARDFDSGSLFPTLDNPRYRASWRRAADHLGLADDPQFVPYATRHTFASRLVQRGVSLQIVQQLLGHTTLAMTQRYAHLAPVNFVDAIGVLEPAE
jgi:integrase